MSPHLGLQRIMIPSAQISSLTTGSVTLPSARGAFVQPEAGYWGRNDLNGAQIGKLSFISETTSTSSATTSTNNASYGGVANSGTAGYYLGGYYAGPNRRSVIDKIIFATDTRSSITNLPTAVNGVTAFANQGTAAYKPGGTNQSVNPINEIAKILFSNDTVSTLGATISEAREAQGSFGNKSVAGYVIGGTTPAVGGASQRGDKLTFSTETNANLGSFISPKKRYLMSFNNDAVAGYSAGGDDNATAYATILKVAYSSDTLSTVSATLSVATSNGMAGCAYVGVAGYGNVGSGQTLNKFTFSNETISTLASSLPATISAGIAFGNSGSY
jgi:hypothetical protein